MKGTDLAKEIRKLLKEELGYNSRQVGVRNRQGGYSTCIRVTVKDLNIPLEPIEKLTEQFEYYQRDYATQEILCGGNTFIDVSYDWRLEYA
jgi:hypothetical protein